MSKHPKIILSLDIWISSFIKKEFLINFNVSPQDSFGKGIDQEELTEDIAEPLWDEENVSSGLPGVSEKLLLAGFLTTWLCMFVHPSKGGSIRASSLLAASLLSRGDRLSLAPAVLARIFRVFRAVSVSGELDIKESLTWYYIHAWVHIHVQGAFSCLKLPSFFMERGYPIIMHILKASSVIERERIRFFFAPHQVKDQFAVVHKPSIGALPDHYLERNFCDRIDSQGMYAVFLKGRTFKIAEYFISMRPAWLCYRSGGSVILEGYHPNRAARQFGYAQASAYNGLPLVPGISDTQKLDSEPLNARMEAAATMWAYLLRLGTGNIFRFAAADSITGVSYHYLMWVKFSFSAALERGTRLYEPLVRELGLHQSIRRLPRSKRNKKRNIDVGKQARQPSPVKGKNDENEHKNCDASSQRNESPPKMRVRKSSSNIEGAKSPPRTRRRIDTAEYVQNNGEPINDEVLQSILPERILPEIQIADDEEVDVGIPTIEPMMVDIPEAVITETEEFLAECSYSQPVSPHCIRETSEMKALICTEVCSIATHGHVRAKSVEPHEQSSSGREDIPNEVPDFIPDGTSYESQIYNRCTSPYNPRNVPLLLQCTDYLQDLIVRINPQVPRPLTQFVNEANDILDFLAGRGIPEDKLRYLENWARAVEYVLRQAEDLPLVQTRIPVAVHRRKVEEYENAVKQIRMKYTQSDNMVKEQLSQLTLISGELDSIASQVDQIYLELERKSSASLNDVRDSLKQASSLHQKLESLIQHGSDLEITLGELKMKNIKEERYLQSLQSKLLEAEIALAEAVKNWNMAKTDYTYILTVIQPWLQYLYYQLS